MFRLLTCPSSGGQIVLSQHLVSSLSVNNCTICRTRAESAESALIGHIVQLFTESDDTRCCDNTICSDDGHVNARNMSNAESALIRHTVLPLTESDVTRCCDNTICPPEDWHVNARNMSKIVM
jgi:hypothetical protein